MVKYLFVVLSLLSSAMSFARDDFFVGVGTHVGLNQGDPRKIAGLVWESGANSLRDDITWGRVEERKNVVTFAGKAADVRQMVLDANLRGVRPLLVLAYGNRNHTGGGFPLDADQRAAFVRYAVAVAGEFEGRLAGVEIWNEWNAGTGLPSPGSRGQAAAYVDLLRAVYPALKQRSPKLQVFGGAVAGLDDVWIRQVVDAGGLDFMDVLTIHPYVFNHWDKRKRTPEYALEWLDELQRAVLSPRAKRAYPIAITEIGWPTNQGPNGSSRSLSAQYLERFFLLAAARPWIKGVWWYDLRDDGDDPSNQEHAFGIVGFDYVPKVSFDAFRRVTQKIKNATTLSAPSMPAGVGGVCLRNSDGTAILAVWCTAVNCSLRVDAGVSIDSDGSGVSASTFLVSPQVDYYLVTTACEQVVSKLRITQ